MRDAIDWCRWLALVLTATGMAGCDWPTNPEQTSWVHSALRSGGKAIPVATQLLSMPAGSEAAMTISGDGSGQSAGEHDILRVRTDVLRGRTWVLSLDDVRVYDLSDRRLIRRIALPPWSVAAELCMPDMALDPSGSAVIASNAQPTLIRIDAASFRLTEHEIRLRGRESWAIGFGALAFASDGALYGLVALGNSLWRIDVTQAVAEMVEYYDPPLERCELTTYAARLP